MEISQWMTPPIILHRGWKTKWAFKDLLTEETDSEAVARIAKEFHDKLEKYRIESCDGLFAEDNEIEMISCQFHTIGYSDGPEKASIDEFNFVLDELYDWADYERVWID